MKLKKCLPCKKYTLHNECPKCSEPTKSAHYKFVNVRSLVKTKRKINRSR